MNSQPHNVRCQVKSKNFNIRLREQSKRRVCLFIFSPPQEKTTISSSVSHSSGVLSLRALPCPALACRSHEDHPQSTLRKSFRGFAFPLLFLMPKHRQEELKGRSGTAPTWQSSPCPLDQTRQMCYLHPDIWESNPQSKLQVPSFLAANWCMCSCCRVGDSRGPLPQPFFVFAVALSAPPCAPLSFPPSLLSFLKPGAGGEEWMTFSCLHFLCQKISKRHSSSLNAYNQSIPGHNKLGPIRS